MKTIRWVTPRIKYTEIIDSFGEFFYDLAYNVWDFPPQGHAFTAIRKELKAETYKRFMKMPWFVVPSSNPSVEERHFYSVGMGREESLSPVRIKQFMRNFTSIWHWRPKLKDLVLKDIEEFESEDPRYRIEFDRWYRSERQEEYRRPHFYREFLKDKLPMGIDIDEYQQG